jgi:hypothetical protein
LLNLLRADKQRSTIFNILEFSSLTVPHHSPLAGPRVIFRAATSLATRKLPHQPNPRFARSGCVTIVRVQVEQGKRACILELCAKRRKTGF